jgi:urease accessory protein
LAMLAVGLWAIQLGGRALWALPGAFLLAMGAGAALGAIGVALPFVEPLILSTTLALGALVAFAKPIPLAGSAALVAVAALFHGQAHGLEMPATLLGAQAAAGFLLATASLLLAGLGIGLALQLSARQEPIRLAGAAIFSITLFSRL